MAKSTPPWTVRPRANQQRFAFFLSHMGEDKPFVARVKQLVDPRLRRAGARLISCFIDVKHWERGLPALSNIQDAIFASAYFAVFVTPAYLDASRRGWTWLEFAFANLIDKSRKSPGARRFSYIVPVFRGVNPADFGRTPLVKYWHRNLLQSGDEDTPAAVAEHLAGYFLRAEAKR